MMRIDTSEWKEFLLSKIGFVNYHGQRLNKVQRTDGSIPFVTAGFKDRGISQYIGNDRPVYNKAITIDMFGNCFFQPIPCSGDDNVYFFVNNEISENAKLFIATCLHAKLSVEYAYTQQFRQSDADSLSVLLPIESHGYPDWAYVDFFMEEVMRESETYLENLRLIDNNKAVVDISHWKEFEIGKLFEVVKGTRLTKANMREGKNRFIGSSAMCNGMTMQIENDEKLHPANTITVCYNGSVGETFYQDEPFWASDDVNVLYPKFEMNKYIGLFIAPLIRSVGRRYAFVDKWRLKVMKKDCIKLPIDSKGNPDWAYMDSYMQAATQDAKSNIEKLSRYCRKNYY
ncbi:restriction endonuclease subunit S [Lancefieldella parvula]|uniref:restriction endonuclease subunit S n=1 Tax=Lancefieldella parvula TaxID=1382 RepID=UPI0009DE4C0F|nr:restriction endonuclease subunit S [Lancefieldella parvula]